MLTEAVRVLIADHLAVPLDVVREDASFVRDLGADSLDMIELTMRIEQELDISINDDEGEFCKTVGQALKLVGRKVIARAA